MGKGKSTSVLFKNDGTTEIAAYCITTDSWQDYLHYLQEARKFKECGDLRAMNRSLRATLLFLFSHLEGVVNRIYSEKNIPTKFGDRLCDKTLTIRELAKIKGPLPYLNFRLGKHLRDILVHVGKEVNFEGENLTERSLYRKLSVNSLTEMGNMISSWLDAVCKYLNVMRFTDTKSLVEKMGHRLESIFWEADKGEAIKEV